MICSWAAGDPLLKEYHDNVWGKECHDDIKLFEYLILEGFQAGLSWLTILKKQNAFEEAFYDFDIEKVSQMTEDDINRLMQNKNIIRNRLKIKNTIRMANIVKDIQKEFGSLDKYVWSFTHGKVICGYVEGETENDLSRQISKDLYARGCRFVGPVICYSYLEAVGVFNHHVKDCEALTK